MLRALSWPHHLAAGAGVAAVVGMAALGISGTPRAPERFDAKLVVVTPADPDDPTDDGLRIWEVIDQDFGGEERRGHERYIPIDFGVPTSVQAGSPTAPDAVRIERIGREVRIRIGDPDITVTGQHRYLLAFTLPEARLSRGELALDIIDPDEELGTERFEVVVTGLALDDPTCNVGAFGASGGCTLEPDGDRYRAVIEPLRPGQGITIGGTITGRRAIDLPDLPPLPPRRETPDRRLGVALGSLPLGLLAVGGVHRVLGRAGRDEVFGGGGAADAAFGALAAPDPGSPSSTSATPAVSRVTDSRLADLATVEFAPPPGLQPWEGAVLLKESIDNASVSAWFSGLAGHGFIDLEPEGKRRLVITPGPRLDRADPATRADIDRMFGGQDRLELGTYDAKFATFWASIRTMQSDRIGASGWWRRLCPGAGGRRDRVLLGVATALALVVAGVLVVLAFVGLLESVVGALVLAVVLPAAVAFTAYSPLLPARSATGAALALRTESFRRFLDASEGQHVEWAWERGVIREYSAWAVALGAADAWSKAVARSGVVPDDRSLTSPLLFATMATAVQSARFEPSSSSGGSGGFSGGSVGGGGGGGRSGSW